MPEPHLRAADADRTEVADVLGAHMSAGRLTVAEYDDRLARAYAARTYGELAELTADLPAVQRPAGATPVAVEPVAKPAPAPAEGHGGWVHGWGRGNRAAWASWASTSVLVIGIWAITCIASQQWVYPWPIWVVGPWGLVLLSQSMRSGPGRDRQRDRRRGRDALQSGHRGS